MSVDYDAIAHAYDRRYLQNDYSGIEQALMAFVGRGAGTCVVEVGCGTGHWIRLLQGHGVWAAGLDASIGMLTRARALASCPVVHSVAEHLPLRSQSVDRVFCVNAFHHFQNKPAFLAEARRGRTAKATSSDMKSCIGSPPTRLAPRHPTISPSILACYTYDISLAFAFTLQWRAFRQGSKVAAVMTYATLLSSLC